MDSPMETPYGNSYKKWKFSQENPRSPRLFCCRSSNIVFHTHINEPSRPSHRSQKPNTGTVYYCPIATLSSSTARINTNRTELAEHLDIQSRTKNPSQHRTRDMSFAIVVVCVFPILSTRFIHSDVKHREKQEFYDSF